MTGIKEEIAALQRKLRHLNHILKYHHKIPGNRKEILLRKSAEISRSAQRIAYELRMEGRKPG